MNLKQALHILIGLLWIAAGACLAYYWSKEVITFVKGALPFVLAGIGILWALIGYILAEDVE